MELSFLELLFNLYRRGLPRAVPSCFLLHRTRPVAVSHRVDLSGVSNLAQVFGTSLSKGLASLAHVLALALLALYKVNKVSGVTICFASCDVCSLGYTGSGLISTLQFAM